jgi:simple sugar transport system ATP-binding protein
MHLHEITKSFGLTRAVDGVSLSLTPGEIVGLVGENGAGKTTLMRIAAREVAPDSGTVSSDTKTAMVHQHFVLVSAFTIAENIALSARTPQRAAQAEIANTGIALSDPARRVADLAVGEKAKLELIKALMRQPDALILDEPTAVLTPGETSELFDVIRRRAAAGAAVIFISHKLPEVLAVATRIVVMRRGSIVAEYGAGAVAEDIARAMVDGAVPPLRAASTRPRSEADRLVSLEDVTGVHLDHASLHVDRGEIVAVVGVAGNGQTEIAALLRGIGAPRSGRVTSGAGRVAHIPEDRTRDGIVAQMSVAENLALGSSRWSAREANRHAARLIAEYGIRARDPAQLAGELSGGNQQKVVLARELDRNPDLIVAAEPTRGLDLEATRFVHERLRTATARGAGVLLITSDTDEAFALADAIHVIYRGRLSARLSSAEASARLGSLLAGVT